MDWKFAIERQHEALLVVVASLFTMIGLTEGGSMARIRPPLYRKVLGLLRPAEAAVRRLIVTMALGLKVEPPANRAAPAGTAGSGKSKDKSKSKGQSKGKRQSHPLFRLFDPPRRIGHGYGLPRRRRGPEPRVRLLGPGSNAPAYVDLENGVGIVPFFARAALGLAPMPQPAPPSEPDDSVNALRLCRRLAAITDALKDLPRQAMRYAKWKAKSYEQRRPKRFCALRTGPPPYLRRKSKHAVHEILDECHWLARQALKLDTS